MVDALSRRDEVDATLMAISQPTLLFDAIKTEHASNQALIKLQQQIEHSKLGKD